MVTVKIALQYLMDAKLSFAIMETGLQFDMQGSVTYNTKCSPKVLYDYLSKLIMV